MSLLLDALQRASREKAAGATHAPAAPPTAATSTSQSESAAPSTNATVLAANSSSPAPTESLALSLAPADWPDLKPSAAPVPPAAPLEIRPQPESMVSARNENVLEFTIDDSLSTRPAADFGKTPSGLQPSSALSNSDPEQDRSTPTPLAMADEPADSASRTAAPLTSASTITHSTPPEEATAASVAGRPAVLTDRQRGEKLAQDILRAHESRLDKSSDPIRQRRRPAMVLGAVALVLALGGGSIFGGFWGDPEALLGLRSPGLVPAASPVPAPTEASSVPVAVVVDPVASSSAIVSVPAREVAPIALQVPAPVLVGKSAIANLPITAASGSNPAVSAVVAPVVQQVSAEPAKSPALRPASNGEISVRTRQPSAVERGYDALRNGQLDGARTFYEAALKSNAQDRDALLGLAYIAARQGRQSDAIAHYQEVIRFDPSDATAQAGLMALESQSGAEASVNRARDLAQRQPESASALSVAAAGMVKEGLLAEAAQLYARAQALEPQNVSHAYNHAVALDRLGQYANALAQYDAAARLADRPGSPIGADGIRQRASALRQALVGVVNK